MTDTAAPYHGDPALEAEAAMILGADPTPELSPEAETGISEPEVITEDATRERLPGERMTGSYTDVVQRAAELFATPGRGSLGRLLVTLASQHGADEVRLNHDRLADQLGVKPAHVRAQLAELHTLGWVAAEPRLMNNRAVKVYRWRGVY